jgi:hypothetical protein
MKMFENVSNTMGSQRDSVKFMRPIYGLQIRDSISKRMVFRLLQPLRGLAQPLKESVQRLRELLQRYLGSFSHCVDSFNDSLTSFNG